MAQLLQKENIDIISITETKLAESKYTNLQLHNETYYFYISNTTTTIAKKQES
ncbi:29000_t:CDS:1, partial [Racocetra persica]